MRCRRLGNRKANERMLIYYSESLQRPNVDRESPVDVSLEITLDVFRKLNPRVGFLGISLTENFVLQLLSTKKGVRIELLDTSIPAVDWCEADQAFAEKLIEVALLGQDVFQVARQLRDDWSYLKL